MSALDKLSACPACDCLHHRAELAIGEKALCRRCGARLTQRLPHTVDRTLAASIAGIILLILSLGLPFLALSRAGLASEISVIDAVSALWQSDMRWLGLLTLAFIILLPLARLLLLVIVLWAVRSGRSGTSLLRRIFGWVLRLEPWAMAEIFLVGVAVSLVKIGSVATLEVGLAFWALVGLILCSLLVSVFLCEDTIWHRLTTRS